MSNLKTGLFWNSISGVSRYIIQFGGVMILARLLSPAEYGVIGLMAILISVAEVLMDGGLCAALIKKTNVQAIDYSTLSVYNNVVSLFLYLVYFVFAPYIENVYKCEGLSLYIRLYSISILLHSLVMAPRTFMQKSLRFKELALIGLFSSFVSLTLAIVMAYYGYGVYSLIFQYVINAFITCLLIFFRAKYIPHIAFSTSSFKEQFSFGIYTTFANILKTISENIYTNVIGTRASLRQTGFYSQATKLMNIPVGFLTGVIDSTYYPILSQIEDQCSFKNTITSLNIKTLKIIILIFTIVIPLNTEIVIFLLGSKWLGTEWTLTNLLFAGLFILWGNIGRNLIKCTGKTKIIFYYEMCIFVVSIFALFVGAYFLNYEGIVYAFLIVSIIKSLIVNVISYKIIDESLINLIRPLKRILAMSFCLIFTILFLDLKVNYFNSMVKILFIFVIIGMYLYFYEKDLIKSIIKK